jgi:adenosylhomocysteine nucleosidase
MKGNIQSGPSCGTIVCHPPSVSAGCAKRSVTIWVQVAFVGLCLSLLGAPFAPSAAAPRDPVHRTAIISAYQPEWLALKASLENREEQIINDTVFVTGTIAGKPVVLFLSGVSMVNAAMTSQLALDNFTLDRLVFSGIAGGVDAAFNIGDIVVPAAWSQYLEAVFAREVDGGFRLPSFAERTIPNFGMIFPQPVRIARGHSTPEKVTWFEVDPGLLEIAGKLRDDTALAQCTAKSECLHNRPRLVVGGKGVSGQAFVDNKAFREYVGASFGAAVLDMESAAVAHVAYANKTPFIAFRSLSDLAGGGEGENEIGTFFQLASDNSAATVVAFVKALP